MTVNHRRNYLYYFENTVSNSVCQSILIPCYLQSVNATWTSEFASGETTTTTTCGRCLVDDETKEKHRDYYRYNYSDKPTTIRANITWYSFTCSHLSSVRGSANSEWVYLTSHLTYKGLYLTSHLTYKGLYLTSHLTYKGLYLTSHLTHKG